jgi:hypothetical protein
MFGVRRRGAYNVLVGKTERPKDLDIGRKVILKWILRRPFGRACTQLLWRTVNTLVNLRFSYDEGNFLTG